MGTIAQKLNVLQTFIPEGITLIAVSKTKPNEAILEAYEAGQLDFGENKVQDLVAKAEQLPKNIRWHMIGHLQRNKVKQVIPHTSLIHGVDSQRLLNEIEKEAAKIDRKVAVLLQMHIAQEETKFGLDQDELKAILQEGLNERYPHIIFRGMMGMATFTDNKGQVKREFGLLKKLFDEVAVEFGEDWGTLSMGMSGDFALAIEEGSTMVRIGSAIFGERN